jgi:hypothetical protein
MEGTEPVPATATPIRIFLLGRFEVARGERVVRTTLWTRRKAAAHAYEAARCLDTAADLWLKRSTAGDLAMAQTTRAEAQPPYRRCAQQPTTRPHRVS